MTRNLVHFTVNGQSIQLSGDEIFAPLSDFLRYQHRATGTKVVCAEGDCGACTVMIARLNPGKQPGAKPELAYQSVNSCIMPTFLADGCHVVTIEGLSEDGRPNEIQQSMIRNFGAQCGFCTPGFVMSLAHMFENKANPSEQNAKNYLTGNLCRCTGYQPIINAALDIDAAKLTPLQQRYALPEESARLLEKTSSPLLAEVGGKLLYAPVTLKQASEFKRQHPAARIYSGATDIGVQINKGKDAGATMMSLHLIEELYELRHERGSVSVGARVTLARLQKFLESHLPQFGQFLNIFASPQIKNSATLVGNLANGSPIADTIPFLLTLDAEIELHAASGERRLAIRDFFQGYKRFAMQQDELIARIHFNLPDANSRIGLYKVSQRRDLDISCVNASFLFAVTDGKITACRMAYGGVAPTPVRLHEVESKVVGMHLTPGWTAAVKSLIAASMQPIPDVRGSSDFRNLMAQQLFEKFARERLAP